MRIAALLNRENGLALLTGALLPGAFAPFGYFWLAPLLLAVLFLLWENQSPREAAIRGMVFGCGAFTTGTYWTYISVHGFGGSPAWLAVLLSAGLIIANAAHIAFAGWLAARTRWPAVARWCLAWPAAWVGAEWVRSWIFTGFPWLSLGYGQIDGPLAAWAPVGGIYAASLAAALCAGLLLCLLRGSMRERLLALGLAVLLAAGTLALQDREWTAPVGEPLRVSLVQGAVPQDQKWLSSQRLPTMDLYRDLSFGEAPVDLVVWPEVAVPAMAGQVEAYLDEVQTLAQSRDAAVLLGILTSDPSGERFHNSLLALGADRSVYHKRHLVPFGEFFPVPDFVREWMRLMNLPYRDAAPGAADQPPLAVNGVLVAPSICYEDAFGAEQLDFLPAATLLVNVSNDAWFGDSLAPHQHLQIARMRALETGRSLLRATNTGITALIGPDGRVEAALPQFEPGVLQGLAQPRGGSTPFIQAGNIPVVLFCLLTVLLSVRLEPPGRGIQPD